MIGLSGLIFGKIRRISFRVQSARLLTNEDSSSSKAKSTRIFQILFPKVSHITKAGLIRCPFISLYCPLPKIWSLKNTGGGENNGIFKNESAD